MTLTLPWICFIQNNLKKTYSKTQIETDTTHVSKTQIQASDGGIFNTQRLKAKTKVTKSILRDLLYADDCVIVAHSKDDLKRLKNSLSVATKRFGLTMSIKKAEGINSEHP